MKTARMFCCLLVPILMLAHDPAVFGDEPLRIGMAEVDITPPEGFPMAGYYHERLATGIRDPLKAKAIVFRDGEEQAALVVCDLTGIAGDLSVEVQRLAAERTGIPAERIVVSATHSHTAPDYTKDLFQYLQAAPASPGEGEPYAARLIGGIVAAIEQAHLQAQPVEVSTGSARQETPIAFNRRFVMKDGSVRTWMSLDNPEVVRPAGPIDPEVGMILVKKAEGGEALGLLSNFALHLDTVGGTLWSGDYPYYVEQSVRESFGDSTISVFGNGCCGDINHVDPSKKERNPTEFIGRELAATVQSGITNLAPVEQPELRVAHTTLKLPLEEVNAEQVQRAVLFVGQAQSGGKVEFFDLVTSYKTIVLDQFQHSPPLADAASHINWGLSRRFAGVGQELPVDIHAIALGRDVAIVCLPGEVFVELGLAIKQASPFRTTLIVELSGCVETMYIPTGAAYAGGSYEVTNSALQPGGGEMIVAAAIGLLREIAGEK